MNALKIKDNLYSVGILNPSMRVFDVVMRTEYGTSYNSYILRGKDKTALIETCHATFFEQYVSNIREVCDPSDIDYIILNHTEPDHSGVLARLKDLCPKAQLVCSRPAAKYLEAITNRSDLGLKIVADGETIDLGGGTVLKFIVAPYIHWPDTMMTWCESEKTLFSCDFFGLHYCEPYMIDKNVAYPEKYKEALKNYYDAIFGPFKSFARSALEKVKALGDIAFICTSHGPILTKDGRMSYVFEKYEQWSAQPQKTNKSIPIFLCTAYGNTEKIGNAIRDGILSVLPAADVPVYDIIYHDMAKLQAELNASDAFAIGSPTINAEAVPPVWELLAHVDAVGNRKKPALVFGSYGWSGEAVPNIITRLNGLKINVFGEGFKVNFVPSEEDLENAKILGKQFAEALSK